MFSAAKPRTRETDQKILLSNYPAESRYTEAFRTLRTSLFFSSMEKELRSVVVTSSVETEGKTTVTTNLGHTIAMAERKVLLIDMDLRRPHLSNLFGYRSSEGVSEILVNVFGERLPKGDLSQLPLSDLVRLIQIQNRTGVLKIANEQIQMTLGFDKGKIVDIHWENRPESRRFANSLIRNKLLTEQEARLALGKQRNSIRRLGSILYTMGLVPKKELDKAVSVHTMEALKALVSMEQGTFYFSPSVPDVENTPDNLDLDKMYQKFSTTTVGGTYFKSKIMSMVQETDTPNLYILPAGAVPPNPSELAGSKRVGYLLEYLKNEFDFILIDTPPVMPATDALLISPNTDGTVLVIRSGNTDRNIVQKVIEQFDAASQPILGTVLNRVDLGTGYYGYYKKYYTSYYGN